MTRHQRRAEKVRIRRLKDKWARTVLQYPKVPLSELACPGVYHLVYQHDDWCNILKPGGKASDCNCHPTISRHKQPTFS